jgi:1,4-alpha-glucan branching enzyme
MVTVECDGSLTFRVYLPHAERVELVADFTDWHQGRLPLMREGAPADAERHDEELCGEEVPSTDGREEGWWTIRVQAPDGDHAFSYLIDDQWWLPDYAAHGVKRNDEGHWTSLLFVPPRPRLVERLGRRRSFTGHLKANV